MKYCTNCGAKIEDGYAFCPNCGEEVPKADPQPTHGSTAVQQPQQNYYSQNHSQYYQSQYVPPVQPTQMKMSDLQTAAFIFMIISLAVWSFIGMIYMFVFFIGIFFLIPLAWIIPMVVYYKNNYRTVGIGFKICTLLFVNQIAGILMLCDQ